MENIKISGTCSLDNFELLIRFYNVMKKSSIEKSVTCDSFTFSTNVDLSDLNDGIIYMNMTYLNVPNKTNISKTIKLSKNSEIPKSTVFLPRRSRSR